MRLPPIVFILGFAGLLPCFAAPIWITLADGAVYPWVDRAWLLYIGLVASFMAGTFWGFSAPAAQGRDGMLGLVVASALMLATWGALILPFKRAIVALGAVYALQIAAEIWRERALDTIPGYFRLRAQLTAGALVALAWRFALA
jgi:hypothetical protein